LKSNWRHFLPEETFIYFYLHERMWDIKWDGVFLVSTFFHKQPKQVTGTAYTLGRLIGNARHRHVKSSQKKTHEGERPAADSPVGPPLAPSQLVSLDPGPALHVRVSQRICICDEISADLAFEWTCFVSDTGSVSGCLSVGVLDPHITQRFFIHFVGALDCEAH
jgi:hypothetical protein